MTNITATQTAILIACSAEFNYDNAEQEKSDHAFQITAAELSKATGINVNIIRSSMASLHKKGLMMEVEEANGKRKMSCMTDEGIDAAFAAVEAADQTSPLPTLEVGVDYSGFSVMALARHMYMQHGKSEEAAAAMVEVMATGAVTTKSAAYTKNAMSFAKGYINGAAKEAAA